MTAETTHGSDRRLPAVTLGILLCAIVVMYRDTFVSIVTIWSTSEAFVHGAAIFPISAALIWQRRRQISQIRSSFSVLGTVLLAFLSLVWWLGDLLGIQVVAQFAAVAMIPAVVLAIAGKEIVSEIRFPLAYLAFAVPFGEFFIPQLIEVTAEFSVGALNILGIPVYQDGRYFHLPGGSFEVAKACSGLKYLLSTLALTTLFSHLLFRGTTKKLAFVVFSIIASIFANGLRATAIVVLLHYTNLNIAEGFGHLVVGWIVYLILLIVLIFVGIRLQDAAASESEGTGDNADRWPITKIVGAIQSRGMGLAFLAIALGPLLAIYGRPTVSENGYIANGLPSNVDGWSTVVPPDRDWRPDYKGYSHAAYGTYRRGHETVNVAIFKYISQRQGAEISSTTNELVDASSWNLGNRQTVPVVTELDGQIGISEVLAWRGGESRLIWHWIEVNGEYVDGIFRTKLAEASNLLTRKMSISTAIIMSTPVARDQLQSRQVLQDFSGEFYSRLQGCMDASVARQDCRIGARNAETS